MLSLEYACNDIMLVLFTTKVYLITNMVINYTWTPRKSSRAHNYKNADDNRDEDTENVTNTEYQK